MIPMQLFYLPPAFVLSSVKLFELEDCLDGVRIHSGKLFL
jgi:hypothetical protein